MEIRKATYIGSWERAEGMMGSNQPEFAFIGRSNVGKSSLINMLCNHKGLARTSAQPGKTQKLNLFDIDKTWNICDLPGYGYAKVSKTQRREFSLMIRHYLQMRQNLCCLFVLIDLRIPPQAIDMDFLEWCGENEVPFVLVGTKADKLSETMVETQVNGFLDKMSETWAELPDFFVSSAETQMGRNELLAFIDGCLKGIG